jgi:arsenate reductase
MKTNKLKPFNVLFLCTGNSCRSQMAEGWATKLALPNINFYSAGIQAHGLNPHAVEVMQESGVDISCHQSQLLSEFNHVKFDLVFAVCDKASENCPTFSYPAKIICHQFDDPPALARGLSAERALDSYRLVRDQIQGWISQLATQLPKQLVLN